MIGFDFLFQTFFKFTGTSPNPYSCNTENGCSFQPTKDVY